ncbi:MAG: KH domain-containing protein [Elusimicrobiota bacterium]
MQNLLSYIVFSIVDDKKGINLSLFEKNEEMIFHISANSKNKSKLIGRDGKVINSIRDYLMAVSRKFNKKVYIEIDDN